MSENQETTQEQSVNDQQQTQLTPEQVEQYLKTDEGRRILDRNNTAVLKAYKEKGEVRRIEDAIRLAREEWEKEIDINLWGVINCIKAVVDHLVEKKGGSIVSIASDAGRMGEFREAVYAAAKAGVIGLTKSLARELGPHGIRMNVVCPGATLPTSPDEIGEKSMWGDSMPAITPEFIQKIAKRYPLRRIARPDELAKAVVFLASEGAGFITGQTLSVSGGYTMV